MLAVMSAMPATNHRQPPQWPWTKYSSPLPCLSPDPNAVPDFPLAMPPTPGPKPPPQDIAQLALPSPDSSSSPSSSSASHEPLPVLHLQHYDVQPPSRPKKLRKPPPSSYPFSFIPEHPDPAANFPYAFHRSTPASPAASFLAPRSISVLADSRLRRHSPPPTLTANSQNAARLCLHPHPARLSRQQALPPSRRLRYNGGGPSTSASSAKSRPPKPPPTARTATLRSQPCPHVAH
ncbi:hypothetical protein B0H10DRAFT_1016606 [Mycena sp. CBHHK59/15]|nr:hypothetical protein B0H10DRAFT_1016606 [Mycena sp. CBHHK59/15]